MALLGNTTLSNCILTDRGIDVKNRGDWGGVVAWGGSVGRDGFLCRSGFMACNMHEIAILDVNGRVKVVHLIEQFIESVEKEVICSRGTLG